MVSHEQVWSSDGSRQVFTVQDAEPYKKGWWQKRTEMEKKLFILCATAVLCLSFLSIIIIMITMEMSKFARLMAPFQAIRTKLFGYAKQIDVEKVVEEIKRRNVCLTPGCVLAASRLIKSIDTSVSPCDDFYKFSCGKWIDERIIPDDNLSVSRFSEISESVLQKLRNLLEKSDSNDPFFFKNPKIKYRKCLNETQINERGTKPLEGILNSVGGWPMAIGDGWDEDEFDWFTAIKKMEKSGYEGLGSFLQIYYTVDYRNNSRYIISTSEASLSLSREYLMQNMNESLRLQEYFKLMVNVAVYFGANRSIAEKEAMQVIGFEKRLAELTLPREMKRNFTHFYNKKSYAELKILEPRLPWDEMMELTFEEKIKDKEEILVHFPGFIGSVYKLISKTTKRVLANYLLWRTIDAHSGLLNIQFRDIFFEYHKKVYGLKMRQSRWKTCVGTTKRSFTTAVSALYVRNHFQRDSKQSVMKLVDHIREEFDKLLMDADWMDKKTKADGLEKLRAMAVKMGFPDELLDDWKLAEKYDQFRITESMEYFEMAQKLAVWSKKHHLSFFRKPVDKHDWRKFASVAEVNAYNHLGKNIIQFPAGILQGVFFDKDQPSSLNYGAIGSVIGHEITHGFDDMGRQMDKEGEMNNWWSSATSKNFDDRAKCFVDYYSNFTIRTSDNKLKHLKGINNIGENIADNGGAKEAFLAYQHFVNTSETQDLPLPGLNYTSDQLFWIGFASVWCRKERPSDLESAVETGTHAPGMFRVLGVTQNSHHFARAFSCPPNSPMNPVKKCSVW